MFALTTDPATLRSALERWAVRALPDRRELRVEDVSSHRATGMSDTVVSFALVWSKGGRARTERLVAKLSDRDATRGLSSRHQVALMRFLRRRGGLPIPPARLVDTSATPIAAAMVVMPFVDGRIAQDIPPYTAAGWYARSSSADRATVELAAMEHLARLHAINTDLIESTPALRNLEQVGPTELVEHLCGSEPQAAVDAPLVTALVKALSSGRPADDVGRAVVWGDARLGNYIFAMRSCDPLAMIDWSTAFIGPPEYDVGHFLYFRRLFSELAVELGRARPVDDVTTTELLAVHAASTGRRLGDLTWFEAVGALHFNLLLPTVLDRLGRFGTSAGSAIIETNERLVTELIHDLAAPFGETGPARPAGQQ
jgi:aminoglycoside phosphotransferase (APT) family kinase protein